MKKLIVFVVLLLGGGLVAAEIVAPPFVEARVEDQFAERTEGAARIAADVASFPLVTRVAATGEVRQLDVRLDEVARQQLTLATVRLTLEGIRLDRGGLLGGQVQVKSIDRGEVTAEISQSALAEALGVPARLEPGGIVLDAVSGDLAGELGALVVSGLPGAASSLPLPEDLIPCAPTVEVNGETLVLRCTFDEVPEALVRVVTG